MLLKNGIINGAPVLEDMCGRLYLGSVVHIGKFIFFYIFNCFVQFVTNLFFLGLLSKINYLILMNHAIFFPIFQLGRFSSGRLVRYFGKYFFSFSFFSFSFVLTYYFLFFSRTSIQVRSYKLIGKFSLFCFCFFLLFFVSLLILFSSFFI